jgi:hypothetical protein
LKSAEKITFDRLSVFVGGRILETAEAVIADPGNVHVSKRRTDNLQLAVARPVGADETGAATRLGAVRRE